MPVFIFQMCMSVAIMSPTQYELAYGDAVEIVADVKKSFNWTYSEILHNQTVKVYGTEKMHWRGECFLAAGKDSKLFDDKLLCLCLVKA